MSIQLYPQLDSGALSQFPIRKRRRLRTVRNAAADGRSIKLADEYAEVTEWNLQYRSLSDEELAGLESFVAAVEGTLIDFTFLDPTDNLLAWSDQLENNVWEAAPFLSLTAGVSDPEGTSNAWRLVNSGEAAQSIVQTLAAPGGYRYCFSAFVRSTAPSTIALAIADQRAIRPTCSAWTRVEFSCSGNSSDDAITFGVEILAGGTMEVYGPQVEPQLSSSLYKPTTRGGVYRNSRMGDDLLTVTTSGPNCHACTVNIIHASHI